MKYLLVFLGGGAGSVLRYLFYLLQPKSSEAHFPFATLWVNLIGCLLIGLLYSKVAGNDTGRLLLLIGILGGFTTFSSFGLDTFHLFQNKQWQSLFIYLASSNIGGLVFVWLGYRLSAIF